MDSIKERFPPLTHLGQLFLLLIFLFILYQLLVQAISPLSLTWRIFISFGFPFFLLLFEVINRLIDEENEELNRRYFIYLIAFIVISGLSLSKEHHCLLPCVFLIFIYSLSAFTFHSYYHFLSYQPVDYILSFNGFLSSFLVILTLYLPAGFFGICSFSTTGDEPHYLMITHSILYDFDLDQSNNYRQKDYFQFHWFELKPKLSDIIEDGKIYSQGLGVLFPLMLLPGYFIAGRWGSVFIIVISASAAMALAFRLYYLISTSLLPAFLAFIAVAFSYPMIAFTSQLYPEMIAAFFLLLMVNSLEPITKIKTYGNFKSLVLLCAGTAILIFLKVRFAPPVIALWIFYFSTVFYDHFWKIKSQKNSKIAPESSYQFNKIKIILPFFILLALFLSFCISDYLIFQGDLLFNRFGSLRKLSPYFPGLKTIRGGFGLLLDQEAGLLIYSPIYFIAIWGLFIKKGITARVRYEIMLVILLTFFVISSHPMWHSIPTPPARYIMIIIPLSGVFIAQWLKEYYAKAGKIYLFLTATSILIGLVMLVQPQFKYNYADGTSAIIEYLEKVFYKDLCRFFPSFIRPSIEGCIICLVLIILASLYPILIRHHKSRSNFKNSKLKNNFFIPIYFGVLLITPIFLAKAVPQFVFEAEDLYDFTEKKGVYFPRNPDPHFHNETSYGWEFNVDGNASIKFQLPFNKIRVTVIGRGKGDTSSLSSVKIYLDSFWMDELFFQNYFWQPEHINIFLDKLPHILSLKFSKEDDDNLFFLDKIVISPFSSEIGDFCRKSAYFLSKMYLFKISCYLLDLSQFFAPLPAEERVKALRIYLGGENYYPLADYFSKSLNLSFLNSLKAKQKHKLGLTLLKGRAFHSSLLVYNRLLAREQDKNLCKYLRALSLFMLGKYEQGFGDVASIDKYQDPRFLNLTFKNLHIADPEMENDIQSIREEIIKNPLYFQALQEELNSWAASFNQFFEIGDIDRAKGFAFKIISLAPKDALSLLPFTDKNFLEKIYFQLKIEDKTVHKAIYRYFIEKGMEREAFREERILKTYN